MENRRNVWNTAMEKIRGVKLAEILKNRRNVWIIAGVAVVLVLAVVLIIASVHGQASSSTAYQTTIVQRGTLTSSVEGSGTVASIHTDTLVWQTSGQVSQVNVKIGDQVQTGDVLATLSQTSLSPSVINAQVDLVTAQRNLDSVLHSTTQSAQAQIDLITAQKNYDSAKSSLDTLSVKNRGGTSADIQQARSKLALAQNACDRAQTAYNNVKDNPDSDPSKAQAYLNLYNAQQSLHTAQNNLNYYLMKPSTSSTNQAQANFALAEAKLADAQRAWDRLKNGPDPNDVAAAQAKVDAAQAIVNQAQIAAPFDGTITQASVNPGDIVSAGGIAFRVDDLSQMVVTVQVIEIDVNNVKAGQPATITFDAIPNKIYNGKVIQVDMAGTVGQNSTNFSATVELTDSDALVKPGMAANVTILTNQVENALLVPSTAIFTDDTTGQQYVYLIQNGIPTPVTVTVGAVSDTSTQITGDTLKEGDTIVLSFASTSSSSGGGFGLGGGLGVIRGGSRVVENAQPAGTP